MNCIKIFNKCLNWACRYAIVSHSPLSLSGGGWFEKCSAPEGYINPRVKEALEEVKRGKHPADVPFLWRTWDDMSASQKEALLERIKELKVSGV